MSKVVNTCLKNFINKKNKKLKESKSLRGVSVITCTNNPNALKNIIENYERQNFTEKELIIIINNNHINIEDWKSKIGEINNINIFKLDEKISLGKCLNYGVSKSKYDYIAKFDDDDYYGPKYLSEAISGFKVSRASVVGKGTTIVYFVKSNTLALRDPGLEKRFVNFVNGSTLVAKKSVFNKIKFRDMSAAEDVNFCRDCLQSGIRIYSTSKYNHVYMRYPSKNKHTWKISDDELLKRYCNVVGNTKDYIKYANN
ncbi:glycosyltransferase [Anaerosalibacter sp. Marseille-P3206]|uniref:glycosyltransferase n=1 Tax=Anaerosalibacter sp. Marseille-P3206 TaxID=1871005 RepID=UPI00098417C1|nr:glycosyltransferase family 2 protein [Anaerosalibacter sp. Marseille-P3206]